LLKALASMLGLLGREPSGFLQAATGTDALAEAEIEAKIAARAAAKKSRDFAQADGIRDELLSLGILLEDTAAGTTWRRR
jgi:cysteinyl-tRNA synthetase